MISTIVDVAHVLGRLLIDADDHRGALDAATVGLGVEPGSEQLHGDAVSAALANGDTAEAERIECRFAALLAELNSELV